MFDPNGNGVTDPQEEYLAFRIWEEMCGISEEDPDSPEDPDRPSSPG
jgi:hypothetical protein